MESTGVQFVGEEEGVTPLQHYFAQEIDKTLKLPLLPGICFSILVVGGVRFVSAVPQVLLDTSHTLSSP